MYTWILGRTYFVERSIHLIEEYSWLLMITGVQASGVIIDRLLRQCLTHPYNNHPNFRPACNFNGQSLKLSDECGLTISDHTEQHCRNKRSMITPEAWTPVIINIHIYIYKHCSFPCPERKGTPLFSQNNSM